MADINWGLIDTQMPQRFAAIPQQAEQQGIKNALAAIQLQQGASQNKLAGMQVRQAEETMARQNQLRALAPQLSGKKPEEVVNLLMANGFRDEAMKAAESYAKVRKDEREERGFGIKAALDKSKFYLDRLPSVNSREGAASWLAAQYNDPDLGRILSQVSPLEVELQGIPADAAGLEAWKTRTATDMATYRKNQETKVVGPSQSLVNSSGTAVFTAPAAPVRPTGDLAMYEANVAQGYKGTPLDFLREKAAAGRQPVQPPAPIQVTAPDGTVRLYDRAGNVTANLGTVGAQSATFQKNKVAREQLGKDMNQAITELESITKEGGLIDQSTGSGIGKAVDFTAGLFGAAPAGAVAIAKLKPIADLPLKMIPRFEGPQSDKDTQSYKEAAGQLADASLPNSVRKAAAKEILRLMKIRKGQFVTQDMATQGITGSESDPLGLR